MAFWDKQEIIGTFSKNKAENIVISSCTIDQKKFVDIRTYRHAGDETFSPTSKGVVIPDSKREELIKILEGVGDK